MKTFIKWLREESVAGNVGSGDAQSDGDVSGNIPANNIGSGNIANKPMPLAFVKRKGKINGNKRTKRIRVKRSSGI
jgi:hypothetical protein